MSAPVDRPYVALPRALQAALVHNLSAFIARYATAKESVSAQAESNPTHEAMHEGVGEANGEADGEVDGEVDGEATWIAAAGRAQDDDPHTPRVPFPTSELFFDGRTLWTASLCAGASAFPAL